MRIVILQVLYLLMATSMAFGQAKDHPYDVRKEKKFGHELAVADRKFDHFHFAGAAAHYKRTLEIRMSPKVQLKLADTYRLMNSTTDAEFWYRQAIENKAFASDDDWIHYAQMLKANGKYDRALGIFEKLAHKEEWIAKKVESLRRRDELFRNEHAYDVQWATFNSSHKDFSPIHRNGQIVFVSGRENSGRKHLWDQSNFLELYTIDEGVVTEFHSNINTSFHEGPSTFFDGGNKMFFSRNNFHRSRMGLSKDGINKLKIYYSESTNGSDWSQPTEFIHNSDEYSTAHPSITDDGKTIYFASDMPGGFGGVDIYKAEFKDGRWSSPQNLGANVNTPRDEMFPFIRSNGVLYFSSKGHYGLGGLDLFSYVIGSNKEAENMGYPVNTNSDDFGISFYQDTNKAYFSSNRAGGMGEDDIYSLFVYDYAINVTLVDAITMEPISSKGRIDVLKTMRTHLGDNGISVSKTSHAFGVEAGTSFFVTGSADGYYQSNLIIQIEEELRDGLEKRAYKLPLTRMEQNGRETEILVVINNESTTQLFYKQEDEFVPYAGQMNQLKTYLKEQQLEIIKETYLTNLLYDFDKYSIRSDASNSLDRISEYLLKDSELNIILEAHTDVRGSSQYNQLLSKRRVESARDYLILNGIEAERIFIGSYGEEQTLNDCTYGCNEDEHQQNRRTEIRIEINKQKSKHRLAAFERN
ncbi:MAG: OmpA family protein [Ekhidna sp.]|nr:OmpA family protein [Ekhidna sp.]